MVEINVAGESHSFEAVAVEVEDDEVAGPDPVLGAVPPVFDVLSEVAEVLAQVKQAIKDILFELVLEIFPTCLVIEPFFKIVPEFPFITIAGDIATGEIEIRAWSPVICWPIFLWCWQSCFAKRFVYGGVGVA